MDLYVYDLDEKLIFKTHEKDRSLIQATRKVPTIVTLMERLASFRYNRSIPKKHEKKSGTLKSFTSFLLYDIRNKLLLTLIVLEIVSLILSSILGFSCPLISWKPLKVLRDTMDTIRKDPQSDIHMPEIDTKTMN